MKLPELYIKRNDLLKQVDKMRLRKFKFLTFLPLIVCLLGSEVYAMSQAKEWVNKIRPGTFKQENVPTPADQKKQEDKSFTKAEMKVLTALKKREDELKKREQIHQQKANELKNLSQQIEQKLDQMRKLAAKVEGERKKRKEMDERDISKIVKFYEIMTPENTVTFFNKMDRQTATHILLRMGARKASAVMQLLDPAVAVEITEQVTRFKANREENKKK
jgi:flagellar motility protein MotE (MotC chaperone)